MMLIRKGQVLQKLQDYWNERSAHQRLMLAAVFAGSILAVAAFGWLTNRPGMSLLYGGLDPAQAGEVIAEIERSGIRHEVRGDTIWVDSDQRDRLRMDLAAQGLPQAGGAGYELLDGMSGFGTTSQMFDAAYWRAKEGELARTILALPNVQTARVHLAVDNGRGYRREAGGAASVTLTTRGAAISRDQAAALQYLISSGVPGMTPESVTVIDSARGIVAVSDALNGQDREVQLKQNVERILQSHVGAGNAIVELNLDRVTETEQLTESRIDPNQRALISEVTEETSDQSNSTGAPAVTAASNLPDQDQAKGSESQSNRSENRNQANYEVSQVTREVSRQPGATRRMTVAVLVNGVTQTDAEGNVQTVPRSEAELQTLRELVASAVGFDETRGDVITVKSLAFADLAEGGTLARPGLLERLEVNGLIRMALIGAFVMAVLMLVMRPALRARTRPEAPAGLDASLPPALPMSGTLQVEDTPEPPGLRQITPPEARPPEPLSLPSADPVARLRGMMRERHDESVKILSGWIDNKESV